LFTFPAQILSEEPDHSSYILFNFQGMPFG